MELFQKSSCHQNCNVERAPKHFTPFLWDEAPSGKNVQCVNFRPLKTGKNVNKTTFFASSFSIPKYFKLNNSLWLNYQQILNQMPFDIETYIVKFILTVIFKMLHQCEKSRICYKFDIRIVAIFICSFWIYEVALCLIK